LPREARSACDAHREWIEAQVQLGRNAISVYQDLVDTHGFTHRYNSGPTFVRTLKVRELKRFDVPTQNSRAEHLLTRRTAWSAEEGSKKGANRALRAVE
jgi:hypothetical protein